MVLQSVWNVKQIRESAVSIQDCTLAQKFPKALFASGGMVPAKISVNDDLHAISPPGLAAHAFIGGEQKHQFARAAQDRLHDTAIEHMG